MSILLSRGPGKAGSVWKIPERMDSATKLRCWQTGSVYPFGLQEYNPSLPACQALFR